MAFKPLQNQEYYLIAKHSSKAVGFVDGNHSTALTQMDLDLKNKHQKFRFELTNEYCCIASSPYQNCYLAVNYSSPNDGAVVIQWLKATHQPNERFQIEPAGGGFYRIRAQHSYKFFHVKDGSKDVGALVVQQGEMDADCQMFKLVPVVDQSVEKSNTTYVQINETARLAVMGMLGGIPKVGSGFKFVLDTFWKSENKLADLWDQMKNYVDERIRQFLVAAKLEALRKTLMGELNAINRISKLPGLKGNDLNTILTGIEEKEPHFLDQSKEVLPYLVGLGTITITLNRIMLTCFKELFGRDPNAEETAFYKKELKDNIKKYTDAVTQTKTELMNWRMTLIPDMVTGKKDGTGVIPRDTYYSLARDNYNNWEMRWERKGDQGDANHKDLAANAVHQRREQVRVQYESELDDFLRLAMCWKYFDPETPAYSPVKAQRSVGAFGGPYVHGAFAGPDGKKITKIIVHSRPGGRLCGIEIFYDGTTSGMKGVAGGHKETLEIGANEYVNSVHGYMNHFLEGVWFTTQKGHSVGGGVSIGSAFSADLSDGLDAKLVKISGSVNGDMIERLTFKWEYID